MSKSVNSPQRLSFLLFHYLPIAPRQRFMSSEIEVDLELTETFTCETQIPEEILCLIPSHSVTISALLEKTFPTVLSTSAVSLKAELCVTSLTTRWTVGELFETPIPPTSWTHGVENALKKKLEIAEIPGTISVMHPMVEELRFPPWVINVWYALAEAAKQRETWIKAKDWVLGQVQDTRAQGAIELMGRIPWGMKVWALPYAASSPVGVLGELLSTSWVKERQLDTIASYLNFRASKSTGNAGECWAGDAQLSAYVTEVYTMGKAALSTHSGLMKYRDFITAKSYKYLVFPANLNNKHWVVFGVDLVKKQFCYGMSSSLSKRENMLAYYHTLLSRRLARSKRNQDPAGYALWAGGLAMWCFWGVIRRSGQNLSDRTTI